MITKEMLKKGYEKGIVRLVKCPNEDDEVVCQIGENWFYFGGFSAEGETPENYVKNVPLDDIISEIFDAIDDFKNQPETQDEYNYYLVVLNESGISDHCVKADYDNVSANDRIWTGRKYRCVYGINQGDVFTVTSEPRNIDHVGNKSVFGCSVKNGRMELTCTDLESFYWEEMDQNAEETIAMSEVDKNLITFILENCHSCPLDDECGFDFEKYCVGFRENGCMECIFKNTDKLR